MSIAFEKSKKSIKNTNKVEKIDKLTDEALLKKYLKSEEEIIKFRKIDDYQEKIKQLREYNEKINTNLDKLEKKANLNVIETKYTVEELIKELEKTKNSKNIISKIPKNINEAKELVEEKIATTKEDLKKSFREKIEKKWLIMWTIGTWLFDWVEEMKNEKDKGFFDKIWIKIGTAILGIFLWKGLMDGYKKDIENMKNKTKVVWNKVEKWVSKIKNENKKNEENTNSSPALPLSLMEESKKENKRVENKETIEEKENTYFKFWKFFVKKMWYESFNWKNNFETITADLKDKKYFELKNYTFEKYKEEFQNDGINRQQFDKVKKNLEWSDMFIFFSSIITQKSIKELSKIEKFNSILVDLDIDKENFNWEKLTIKNIFILFSLIISTEIISWIESIPWLWKEVFEKFLEIKEKFPWYEKIKKDLEEAEKKYEKDVMPKKLIKKIFSINQIKDIISYSWDIKYFEKYQKFDENEKKYLQKVIDFRDEFDNKVLNNNEFTFENETRERLKKQIRFQDIFSLYLSTKWKIDINDAIFTWKVLGLFFILEKRNNKEAVYFQKLIKHIDSIDNKKEKNKYLFSKLLIEKIIIKWFYDPLFKTGKKIWNWVIELVKNNKIETGIWLILLSVLWKTFWKAIMKMRTLMYLFWASTLVYWYYWLKQNWVSNIDLKTIRWYMEKVWTSSKALDSVDSWEYKSLNDYNKIVEWSFKKLDKKEINSNLWKFEIVWNKLFFTDKNNEKFELKFVGDIEDLWETMWFEWLEKIWEKITNWTFEIEKIEFVQKNWKYFININDDYFLDLNTIQQDWHKYKIDIWEISQENLADDLSSAKDLILDWFHFDKI